MEEEQPSAEPEAEDDIEVGIPIAGSDDGRVEEAASTSTSGSVVVETDEDRPRRHMFADLGEVNSPEHWMRGNHFADSCSEADDLSIDDRQGGELVFPK